jgi:hypothetical protein
VEKMPQKFQKRVLEAWCEVVDSEGRIGAFCPAPWLEVVE